MLTKLAVIVLFISASVNCQSYGKGGRFEQQYDSQQQQQQPVGQQYQENEAAAPNSVEEPEGAPEPPAVVPQTSFSCEGKPYNPGMYADMEVGCTVYHMCFNGRKESFLCGTGTVFNQEILSCDHPVNVDCNASPSFYVANEELGKPGAEPAPGGAPAPRPAAPRPIPQAPAPVVRPRPIAQAPRPAPIARPRPIPQQVPQDYEDIAPVQRPAPPPAPIPRPPRPSKVAPPRPAPVYRPPAKIPQQRPVPIPRPAPQPIYRPAPAPVQRPVARPSKTSVPRPRPIPAPAPRPIVQTTNEDDYGYEPSDVYYQEVPARQVNYKSSNNQRRRWAQYRS